MRIEANRTSELDDKELTINWNSNKKRQQILDIEQEFTEQVEELKERYGIESLNGQDISSLSEEEQQQLEDESTEILAKRNRQKADVMFEFEEGLPSLEWFKRDEFPIGQFQFLEQVFTDPQIQT